MAAVLCEHHGSADGYLPSPTDAGSGGRLPHAAVALNLILILPFYDPVRLAEDMSVLDILSAGRASYVLALGYRPEEYEHFGLGDAKIVGGSPTRSWGCCAGCWREKPSRTTDAAST